MAKGNGSTRSGSSSSPKGLSGPELWAYNRAQAPVDISKAFEDAGFRATVNRDGSVSAGFNFYDGDKPVNGEINIALHNAEEKTYMVYGEKKKTLDRYQVTNNGGRGRIAIGTKEYARTKKLRDIVSNLSEAIEAVKKFSKKF